MILKIKQGGAKGWTFIGTNIRYFMRDEGYNTMTLKIKRYSENTLQEWYWDQIINYHFHSNYHTCMQDDKGKIRAVNCSLCTLFEYNMNYGFKFSVHHYNLHSRKLQLLRYVASAPFALYKIGQDCTCIQMLLKKLRLLQYLLSNMLEFEERKL